MLHPWEVGMQCRPLKGQKVQINPNLLKAQICMKVILHPGPVNLSQVEFHVASMLLHFPHFVQFCDVTGL